MSRKCFMCGREIVEGILCEKCDRPRKSRPETASKKGSAEAAEGPPAEPAAAVAAPPAPAAKPRVPATAPSSPRPSAPAAESTGGRSAAAQATVAAIDPDPFPKAPVVPFPVESASPAITSVVDLLVAADAAAIVIGVDRAVKFVSAAAFKLFDRTHAELSDLKAVETLTRIHVADLSQPIAGSRHVAGKDLTFNLVPLSGGAGGSVLLFRRAEGRSDVHESFTEYVRETVLRPLRSLHESLHFAARDRNDPVLTDSASAVEQILGALEMAPNVEERRIEAASPTVSQIVEEVAERYRAFAELKSIRLQIDAHEIDERLRDSDRLTESLSILVENALHYVPPNGQVVLGLRTMDHKGRPLLLFFVMDNGPLVPEHLRQIIFEPTFSWQPSDPERTGRALHRCREFAVAHGGSVWAESKTGKACTFFLRIRPDSAV